MKKMSIYCLMIFLFLAASASAQTFRPFGLSLDLNPQGAIGASGKLGFAPGVGGSLFADWRPVYLISLGTGFSYNTFSADSSFSTASWNLGGRLFPISFGKKAELYLQGTLGMNLMTATYEKEWPGSFHGTAGVGYRSYFNEGNALDLGVQYDLYSPLKSPMSAIGIKAGWTFLFGPDLQPAGASGQPETKPVAAPAPEPKPTPESVTIQLTPVVMAPRHHRPKLKQVVEATPTPEFTATPTVLPYNTYTLSMGDKLGSIAIAFYGEADLYPLLVDANKKALVNPGGLKPGVVLRVPVDVSDLDKAGARGKANDDNYTIWENAVVPPSGN